MDRIRVLRENLGWRGQDLAEKLHVKKNTISRYERGERFPDPPTICALCDLLGCTSDYLLGRSDTPWPAVTPEQADLLRVYDVLPLEIRKAVDGLMAPYREQANKKETA